MSDLEQLRDTARGGATNEAASDAEAARSLPSIPSLLGSLAIGLLACGWVALMFIGRGDCERDGVILTCRSSGLETEINLVWSTGLIIFGSLAILRALIGLVLRARATTTRSGSAQPLATSSTFAPPVGSTQALPPPLLESSYQMPGTPSAPSGEIQTPEAAHPPGERATGKQAPSAGVPAPPSAPQRTTSVPPTEPRATESTRPPLYRRPILWIGAVLGLIAGGVIVVMISGGGPSTADARAGIYAGTGTDGFGIELTVEAGGDAISEMSTEVRCGSIGRSETVTFTPPLPIENGRFDVPIPPTGGIGLDGRFVGNGNRAKGDWSTGSCSGTWDAELTSPAPAIPSAVEPDPSAAEPDQDIPATEGDSAGESQVAATDAPVSAEPAIDETLAFDAEGSSWSTPEPGAYRASGARDAFAWSTQTVDGDFAFEVDVTSYFANYGEGMVIVFGDGTGFSPGSLIFNVTGYWQAIRAHSIYEGGGAVWLAENPRELDVRNAAAEATVTMKIEVAGDTARLFVDGGLVASTQLTADIDRSGHIALTKYEGSADVTYSNIRFEVPTVSPVDERNETDEPDDAASAVDTPQKVTPATQGAISAGDHEFIVTAAGFDSTVRGLEPVDGTAGDRILFVEFDLLAGDRGTFEGFEIAVTNDSGFEYAPLALMTDGAIEMLADLRMTGTAAEYQPDPNNITWAYAVPAGRTDLMLVYPSGVLIDLQGLLDGGAEQPDATSSSSLEQLFVDSFYSGMPESMRTTIPESEVRCAASLAGDRLTLDDIDELNSATPSQTVIDKTGALLDECFSTQTVRDLLGSALIDGGFAPSEAGCLTDELGPLTMGDFLTLGLETEFPDEFGQRIFTALEACGLL